MVEVRHRRNHAVAGLGLVLSSILIGMGATQALVKISGPAFSVDLLKKIGITLRSSGSFGTDSQTTAILLACAALIALCGLSLLVTRIRYLGLLWRLGGLVGVALPAVFGYWYWQFIQNPTATLEASNTSIVEKIAGTIGDLTRGVAWDVTPTTGLYFLSAGVVCGLISLLVPAGRKEVPVWTEQNSGLTPPPYAGYGSTS